MTEPTLTPAAFAQKWKGVQTTEKASSQSHFITRLLAENAALHGLPADQILNLPGVGEP